MAILITGGTGFLGSHLARRLVRAGETKIVLIDAYPNPAYVDDIADRVEIVRGDFSESTELLAVLKQHDFSHVFHLGYLTAEADLFPAQAIRINILGTNNLFELARQCGVQKICYASSAAVYRSRRAGDQLWHEDDRPTPTSFYGFCKLSNEYTAELYYLKYGLKHVGLRLQSIYGFGRGQRRGINPDIYARIVESPLAGVPFVAPHTDAVLSWTYVEDAAEAFYLAYKADDTPHRIFNVTGEIRTVGEAVGHINSRLQESCLETGSELAVTLPLADGGRIREELGFVPAYSMERGIDAYIERLNDR
jgi:nucleoside-diphosphate-sugar epimerase